MYREEINRLADRERELLACHDVVDRWRELANIRARRRKLWAKQRAYEARMRRQGPVRLLHKEREYDED